MLVARLTALSDTSFLSIVLMLKLPTPRLPLPFSPTSALRINGIPTLNPRSLDSLQAKILFYHYLTAPRDRAILLAQHKTASLRNDRDTQAVLLNTLLRSLIDANEYQLADKLVNKTSFPASAGSNQWARYLYYCGRIQAIQLDYTASYAHLTNALRKALTTRATAGFQQAVYKVAVIVQLLMGEIPERGIFRQPMLKKALAPYLEITSGLSFLFS
jgi:26S proteasome regulatory subunit N3